MVTQVIRDTEGVITTGKFCLFDGSSSGKNSGGGNGGGGNETISTNIAYVPISDEIVRTITHKIEEGYPIGMYSVPTVADFNRLKTADKLVSTTEDGLVSLNIDFTKAYPFTSITSGQSGMFGLPIIPYALGIRTNVLDEEANARLLVLGIKAGGEGEDVPLPLSDIRDGDSLEINADFTSPFMLNDYVKYTIGAQKQFDELELSLTENDGSTIDSTVKFVYDDTNYIPNKLGSLKLPLDETLKIVFDDVPEQILTSWSIKENNQDWDHSHRPISGRGDLLKPTTSETFVVDYRSLGLYKVAKNFEALNISRTTSGGEYLSSTFETGLWLFIPNQKLGIESVSHNLQYDLQHFSTGTALYLYLGNLVEAE